MIGSANAEYVPLCFETTSVGGDHARASGYIENDSTTDHWAQWVLPYPTTRGGLKLYVSGIKILVYDADANSYVDTANIYRGTETGTTLIYSNTTNRQSQGDYTSTFTAVDCSGDDFVVGYVKIECSGGAAGDCDHRMLAQIYYDS